MAKTEIKHPDRDQSAAPYSAAVAMDGWLFISGQGPLDLKTGKVISGSIEDQTRLTLANVERILQAAGCTFADVVKCGCYLADISEFGRFSQVYVQFFPGIRPARTTVQSVLWGGMKVEIDAIARLKQ